MKIFILRLAFVAMVAVSPKNIEAVKSGDLISAVYSAQVAEPSSGTTSSGSGYITGGSVCAQSAHTYKPKSLFSMTPPEMQASCSNFNFLGGSLSFINREDIVKTVKTAAFEAGKGAFVAGVQVTCPQVAAALKNIMESMEKYNIHSRNFCQEVRAKTKTWLSEKITAAQNSKNTLEGGQLKADELEKDIKDKKEIPIDPEEIGENQSVLECLLEKFSESERLADLKDQIAKYFQTDLVKTLRAICGDIRTPKSTKESDSPISSLFAIGGESDGGGVSNFKNLIASENVTDGKEAPLSVQGIQFKSEPSKIIEQVFEYLVEEIKNEGAGSTNFFNPKENKKKIQMGGKGSDICVGKVAKAMLATSPIDIFHLAELSITSNEMNREKLNFIKIMTVSFTESILMEAIKVMTVLAKTYKNHVKQKMPFDSFLFVLNEAERKIKSMHNQYQGNATSVKDAIRIAKEQQRIKYLRAFNDLTQKGDY